MEYRNDKTILHLIDTLDEGGAQALIREYVHKMKDKYKIVVVTIYDNNTDNIKYLKNETCVETIYKNYNLCIRIFNKIFGFWYIPHRLKKIIKFQKPDVIHAHLLVLWYLKKISKDIKEIKLFYTSHSQPERNFKKKRNNEGEAAKYLIKHNHLHIIALHEDMKNEIDAMFNIDNTVVLKNGVDIGYIRDIKIDILDKRKELNIPSNAYIVGHVGRFIQLKNHKFIVEIFLEIIKKKPNAFLLLIGTGELIDDVKEDIRRKKIEQRTLILSNRTDVPELLHIMDVFIFPSFVEGVSIALLEAQAAGLYIVVSDKVNKANILSPKTIMMNLDESAEKWARVAVDDKILNDNFNKLDDYDINNVINDLEDLYFGIEV